MMGYDNLGKIRGDIPSTQRIQDEEIAMGHIEKKKSKHKVAHSVIEGIRYEETPIEDVSNKAMIKSLLGAVSDTKTGSEASNKRRHSRTNSRRKSGGGRRSRTRS